MELVAWLAGEAHGDQPASACPVLAALVGAADELVPDRRRERLLRPLAPRLVNSRTDDEGTRARAWIALDVAGRFLAALQLARAGNTTAADAVRALPRIDGPAQAVLAAAHLARSGATTAAVQWTLRQAAAERPQEVWVPGIVHALADAHAWHLLPRLVDDLLALRAAVR